MSTGPPEEYETHRQSAIEIYLPYCDKVWDFKGQEDHF